MFPKDRRRHTLSPTCKERSVAQVVSEVVTNVEAANYSLLDVLCTAANADGVCVVLFISTGLPHGATQQRGEVPPHFVEHILRASCVVGKDIEACHQTVRAGSILRNAHGSDGLLYSISQLATTQHALIQTNIVLLRVKEFTHASVGSHIKDAKSASSLLQPDGEVVVCSLSTGKEVFGAVDIFVGVPPRTAATFILIITPTALQDPELAAYIRACAARSIHRMFVIMPYVAWSKLVGI